MLLSHLDSLKNHLKEVEASINNEIEHFSKQVDQLNSISGINSTASSSIIAEIGTDMSLFKTAEHICSWAELLSRQ